MQHSMMFPHVAPNWILHCIPRGGQLKCLRPSEDRSDDGVWELTPLAVKTLLLCDGTMTVQQILSEISSSCYGDGFSPVRSAAQLLTEALQLGSLHLQQYSHRHEIVISGSPDKYYPLHMAVELTDACNLKCKHCYRQAGDEHNVFIAAVDLFRFLGEMRDRGVRSIELSGGEPTLHPEFVEILKYSLNNFDAVSLLTNGTTLSVGSLGNDIVELLSLHKDKTMAQVSLDGCCPEEHDSFRGVEGSFQLTIDAASRLTEAGVRLRVAMVIYPGNFRSIEKTYNMAHDLGAKWFTCAPVLNVGRADERILLTLEQLKESLCCIDKLSRQDPDMIITADELKRTSGEVSSNCGAGSRALTLGPDGQLRPCFVVNKKLPVFGNIHNASTDEILENAPLQYFHSLKAPDKDICTNCDYVSFCSGCVARPLIAWERARKDDPDFICAWDDLNGLSKELGINSQAVSAGT